MAGKPVFVDTSVIVAASVAEHPSHVPSEHAITRLCVLPTGSAAEFMAELEDETEEPNPALRALLRGVAR